MKHERLLTITTPKAPATSIGMLPGAPGSDDRGSSSAIAAWLAERTPAAVDKEARSRLSAGLGVQLDPSFDDWRVVNNNPPAEVRAAAVDELERFMTPAPGRVTQLWLVELSLITSRRADDVETETLRLTAYSDRLGAYPADVVREALLVRAWRWWPSWAELREVCEELVSPRRTLRNALRDWPEELARQRDFIRESIRQERETAEAEAQARAAREAAERERAAQCMGPEGCDDCTCPDVCASYRASGEQTKRGSLAFKAELDGWRM
jgi:hypothetical protein